MDDPHDLKRFVDAQAPVFDDVVAELTAGRKRSHWMWFVFPQMEGLGSSAMARRYAIRSRAEAEAYLAHPVLGERLRRCTDLVAAVGDRGLTAILGSPDDRKFCSSMTLFGEAAPEEPGFRTALDRFCGGDQDRATLARLRRGPQGRQTA